MPTVGPRTGRYRFMVYPNETGYEPRHVHIFISGRIVCRINIDTGEFMEPPPRGEGRNIMQAYKAYEEKIQAAWEMTREG